MSYLINKVIKETIFNENKSSWNLVWNRDIKDIINVINFDNEIISCGENISYKNGKQFLGKTLSYIFLLLNLDKGKRLSILKNLIMTSSILFIFALMYSIFHSEYIILPIVLCFYLFMFLLFFMVKKIFISLDFISRVNYFNKFFYVLFNDKFVFYEKENNVIISSTVNIKDIKSIFYYYNNTYEIETFYNNKFYIHSSKNIEIENLDAFKNNINNVYNKEQKLRKEEIIVDKIPV